MDGKQLTVAPVLGLFLLSSQYSFGQEYSAPTSESPTLTLDSNRHPTLPAVLSPTPEPQPPQTYSVGIKRLDNIDLPWSSPKHGLRGDTNFCVFSSSCAYRVTLSNQAQDGRFYLVNDRFELAVDIYFNDQPGTHGRRSLREGMMLSGLMTPNQDPACHGLSANLSVEVSADDLDSAQAGKYHGWFFLQISPE